MATAVETPREPIIVKPASSAHFKLGPDTRAMRDQVRAEAERLGKTFDRSRPLTKQSLRQLGEGLIKDMGLAEDFLGFAMVCLSN